MTRWPRIAAACLIPLVSLSSFGGAGQSALETRLDFPLGLARAEDGTLFVSTRRTDSIWRIDISANRVSRIAGTGARGFSGDGGPAVQAQLACPESVAVAQNGDMYIADRCNERIRRVRAETRSIETVAGIGKRGPGPDGPATEVALTGPFFVGSPVNGRLLFTDTDAHTVRELDLTRGRITTIAGTGIPGFSGDDGPARTATLRRPHVALRLRSGDVVIGDSENQRLRLIDASTGVIRTIAGSGRQGAAADNTPALDAPFYNFGQIVEEADGSLVFTEVGNGRLVRFDRARGLVRVLAGSTDPGASADDGQAPLATRFGLLVGLVRDGNAYIVTEASTGLVRRIDVERRTVQTIAGVRTSKTPFSFLSMVRPDTPDSPER